MVADLVLTVLQDARDDLGVMAGLAVVDGVIVATGGALSPAGGLEPWRTLHGLRDVLAAGDAVWACGERGQLAMSRDRGASWTECETGTQGCLTGLAAAADGVVWVVGEGGYAARVRSGRLERVELGTTTRLSAVYAVKDDVVVLGADGAVRRWRNGESTTIPLGAPGGLTAMTVTKQSWIVVGDAGFVARSPDGAWFSRVKTDFTIDVEAIATLPDGRVIAVGDRGQILVSPDDGRTWRGMASELTAHLWSVERFGGGALIGGDGGLIVKLAPIAGETVATPAPPPVVKVEVPRAPEPVGSLDTAPRERWTELAWRSLGDAAAHRTLLERLDREPELADQLAALDELRDLDDDERAVALPRVAAELAPEIEAILAGSLVRGDDLAGVLRRPPDDDDDDDGSPGWDAIDRALAPIYGGAEPTAHFGTVLPYMLGGNDPLHGISAYARTEPPHWHFVTYGFTDLFHKETDDPDESGFGFELTFRLARAPDDETVPTWALNFLQNLGRYVFNSGNRFGAGHKMGLNGPIALGEDTSITAICFADDPELGDIESPFGKARFVQIVGITDDEYRLIQEWSTTRLVDMLRRQSAMLITSLSRRSLLADATIAAEVHRFVDAEGSSEDLAFAGDMTVEADGGAVRISLGALYAAALPRAMRGRLRHGRSYELRGRNVSLMLSPGATSSVTPGDDGGVALELAPELVGEIERQLRAGLAGVYGFDAWPRLAIEVTPSFIRDQQNRAIEVKGVADVIKAKAMIDEENARLDAEAEGPDDDDDDDDEGDDEDEGDDDDDEDEGDEAVDPQRVTAALAMTERALLLAPDDDDTQFTHAMLMLDADKAGLDGKIDGLLALLPTFEPGVRINVATRMGKSEHPRFADTVDVALGEALPERIVAERTSGSLASFGDVADELFAELGEAILAYAPDRMARLIGLLPDDVELLSQLAYRAMEAKQGDSSAALYDRLLALPIPDDGDARQAYLRAINNACIQAHAMKAYDTAVRIADHAQPVAHENPYIYHSAACAYAAAGDLAKALQQVELAVTHGYEHLAKLEVDSDLGALLDWPQFKALFRDWHARTEGN